MEMKNANVKTWMLLKRQARASFAAKLKSTGSPSQVS